MGFFSDKRYLVSVGLRDSKDHHLIRQNKKEVIADSWMSAVNSIKQEYGDRYHSVTLISETEV
ncbi:hypothetical protein CH352_00920 [Leptospira hartskeerlii]|uniref:Uncharacterized protein n=1 Tax=Leptospira hartskeerlii TaxID=2023177 RepID=A0A2M9X8E5_9LEPT|nr:hypothetical protein CH357_18500 [Leptospira hartskeerlii]PJZ35230.1 hypothetical protein CH352_00920 [Leptospira hartskeerlii]